MVLLVDSSLKQYLDFIFIYFQSAQIHLLDLKSKEGWCGEAKNIFLSLYKYLNTNSHL